MLASAWTVTMWPRFPQRKNVTFNRACSCCLIAAAYNCCEVATCFWALSVELLARSLVPGGGRKVFLVSNSVDYAWFDTSKEQIWRLQRGCSRLFLNVFPALVYKTSGLHQYEAFGFQILHGSYPCLYAVGTQEISLSYRRLSNHMRKGHASNSLSHSTISSSSNFDGTMLVAIEIAWNKFYSVLFYRCHQW